LTLVSAMINVAIAGLYANVVADGLRLHAWDEPQLAALQEQLREIRLPRLLRQAFLEERAMSTHVIEHATPGSFFRLMGGGRTPAKFMDRMRDPTFLFLTFAPRGWVYQNLVTIVRLHETLAPTKDRQPAMVAPSVINRSNLEVERTFRHFSPNTILAAIATPNWTRAWLTTAFNQTKLDEARLVCALERFHRANQRYPETLQALLPALEKEIPTDVIDGQPLHYRLTESGEFLLYSVGWNEKDDGGMALSREEGDWVWPMLVN